MRLLVLAMIISLMMTNAAFAASEEEAECDMDIEVELLAIQNKEKRALRSKNKSALLVEKQQEQKSIMTDAERQEVIDEGKKE
ncbi:MAG: hypothetical protein QTN59_12680 [Candidatus Electrothrix communis]|nr:MAG: hypothetical protein QTN59_12680 [Candidatus Electrothrix communis]